MKILKLINLFYYFNLFYCFSENKIPILNISCLLINKNNNNLNQKCSELNKEIDEILQKYGFLLITGHILYP